MPTRAKLLRNLLHCSGVIDMAKPEPGRARPNRGRKRNVQSNGLLNYEGGAAFLGIAVKTLQGWCERGTQDVPFIRVGRLIRFSPESLSRWLASREQHALVVPPASEGTPQAQGGNR